MEGVTAVLPQQYLRFCVQLYRMQVEGGRYFVHEHTAGHASWRLKELQELLSGATFAEGDLSQFQVRSPSGDGYAQ